MKNGSVFGVAHIDGCTLVEDQSQDSTHSQNSQIQHDLNGGGGDEQQKNGNNADHQTDDAERVQNAV